MATAAHPLPTAAGAPPQKPGPQGTVEIATEEALAPSPAPPKEGDFVTLKAPVALLPVELEVAVPVREFRVRNLLALELGQVVESQWSHGGDVPLTSGKVQLAWSEFEVIDAELAVRLTRLI